MGSLPKSKKKNIPKSINEMSKEMLEETLKKKRECNAKALQTVEILCEPYVEETWFLENLQFINQSHFDDATVERAILKLCGYPLCTQKLEKIPTQQYHISTRYNKVFDISEKKNFCSSYCYKAANFVKKQLFTSPLWFRDQEVIPKYSVLKNFKSSLGEEVLLCPDKIEVKLEKFKKDKDLSKNDDLINDIKEMENKCSNISLNDSNLEESGNKKEELTEIKQKTNTANADLEKVHNYKKKESLEADKCCKNEIKKDLENKKQINSEHSLKIEENGKSKKHKTKFSKAEKAETSNVKNIVKTEPDDVISKIEKSIFEWFSLDTLFYLYDEKEIKELFRNNADKLKELINSKLKIARSKEKIDLMIQLYGLFDTNSFNTSDTKTDLKPLPDYSVLKEEGEALQIKVRAFYQGQLEIKQPEKVDENKKENENKSEETDNTNYLPLVDSHAQMALRRKIILDKLNRVLPDLIRIFSSEYTLQMADVRNLVSTFSLSAHNISFKPKEWCLVGIILIKLLALKDENLRTLLHLEGSQNQLLLILRSYQLPKHYLDDLIQKLTDSINLLQNF